MVQPTLLHSRGFSSVHSQLLSVPPYTVSALCCLGASFLSDRLKKRGVIFAFLAPLVIVGFAINVQSAKHRSTVLCRFPRHLWRFYRFADVAGVVCRQRCWARCPRHCRRLCRRRREYRRLYRDMDIPAERCIVVFTGSLHQSGWGCVDGGARSNCDSQVVEGEQSETRRGEGVSTRESAAGGGKARAFAF